MDLIKKTYPFSDDYNVESEVLGFGLNGKVFSCVNKLTKEKFALKV
jgi:hypothetical protein